MSPILANIVVDYFFQGGPIMWPILLAFIAAVTVVIERYLWWWNLKRRTRSDRLNKSFEAIATGDFPSAVELTTDASNPFLCTVHEGLLHAHTSLLGAMQICASDELQAAERRQWILGTL